MAKDQALKKDLDKKQVITVVALFAVLIAVLYFFVLSGGEEPPAELGEVPVVEPTEVPAEEPTPGETPDPGETDDPGDDPPTNASRDPFDPPPGAVDTAGNPFESSQPVDPIPEATPTPSP